MLVLIVVPLLLLAIAFAISLFIARKIYHMLELSGNKYPKVISGVTFLVSLILISAAFLFLIVYNIHIER